MDALHLFSTAILSAPLVRLIMHWESGEKQPKYISKTLGQAALPTDNKPRKRGTENRCTQQM